MIRVLVKASSAIIRAGLEQMLASEPGFLLVSDIPGVRPDRGMGGEEETEVVIAEMDDSDDDGEWTDLLDLAGPNAAFLLLAEDPGAIPNSDALRAGVKGILPRRISRDELVAAVHAAAAGLVVLHPDSAASLLPSRNPGLSRPGALVEPLTPREKEVLAILAEGGSNKDIASRLSISEHTAKFHVSSIISKLGATSRTEAVTMAIRQGMIML
jgi:two-component system, NarL family, response regulator YdfI